MTYACLCGRPQTFCDGSCSATLTKPGFGQTITHRSITTEPAVKTMPVNVPFPQWSDCVTIVILDKDGNVTIKVDQEKP